MVLNEFFEAVMRTFKPPYWLRNPHAQTCYPIITRPFRKKVQYQFEIIVLPDGDEVEIARKGAAHAPCILLMPGLEGSCHSPYIQSITNWMLPLGWQVVVMHYRSCGKGKNQQAKSYNSYCDKDLLHVLDYLKHTYQVVPRYAVGCSLGGNILLHHIAKSKMTVFEAVMTISTPFDMVKTVEHMPLFYQKHFVINMKRKTKQKIQRGIIMPTAIEKIADIVTLKDFDNAFTAPIWGHDTAYAYYQYATSYHFLKDIKIPTYMLFSEDDPFIPKETIPSSDQLGTHVILERLSHGGHAGFVASKRIKGSRLWLGSKVAATIQQFETNRDRC